MWNLKNSYDDFYNDFEIYFRFIKGFSCEDAKLSIDSLVDLLNCVNGNGFKYNAHDSNIMFYKMVEDYTKIISDFNCDVFSSIKMSNKSFGFNGVMYDLLVDLIVFEQGFRNMECIEVGLNIKNICYVLDVNIDDVMYRLKEEKVRVVSEEYVRI